MEMDGETGVNTQTLGMHSAAKTTERANLKIKIGDVSNSCSKYGIQATNSGLQEIEHN